MESRIVVNSRICHGKPVIKGTRIMVAHILELLAAGKTFAEIRSEEYYPTLTDEDITAAVHFAMRLVENEDVYFPEDATK
jgi:uncharacterized protein (DUF433 family)